MFKIYIIVLKYLQICLQIRVHIFVLNLLIKIDFTSFLNDLSFLFFIIFESTYLVWYSDLYVTVPNNFFYLLLYLHQLSNKKRNRCQGNKWLLLYFVLFADEELGLQVYAVIFHLSICFCFFTFPPFFHLQVYKCFLFGF